MGGGTLHLSSLSSKQCTIQCHPSIGDAIIVIYLIRRLQHDAQRLMLSVSQERLAGPSSLIRILAEIRTGHTAALCHLKKSRSPANLADLPFELIEIVCGYLVDTTMPRPYYMFAFRLTCKAVNHKSFDFFARLAFCHCATHLDDKGLNRLDAISRVPSLAMKLESLYLITEDRRSMEHDEFVEAEKRMNSQELSGDDRVAAAQKVRQVMQYQDGQDYIERYVMTSMDHSERYSECEGDV